MPEGLRQAEALLERDAAAAGRGPVEALADVALELARRPLVLADEEAEVVGVVGFVLDALRGLGGAALVDAQARAQLLGALRAREAERLFLL